MTATTQKKDALYFLTEQACCLAQAQGRDTEVFRGFRVAAEYLAGGDADAIRAFDEHTAAVKQDLTGDEDYDTEEYEGKKDDVRAAVTALIGLGQSEGTPAEKREPILAAAEIIASFYGINSVDAVRV